MTQQVDAVVSDEIVGDTYVVRKKVDELSLDEIKSELEKRNLDFSGDDYAILHERLTDSMIEEGLEPATFEFELEAEDEEEEEDDEPVAKEQQEEKQSEPKQEAVKSTSTPTTTTTTPTAVAASSKEAIVTSSTTKKEEKKTSAQTQQAPQYKEVPGNHIWVSGLSSRCKAADLKKFFTRYANVGSAKIVANARTNGAHCYGYITVESASDLQKCVEKLHCTRFEGNFIEVEVCKLAPADQLRKVEMKNRERLAQQKEEFRKRKAERRQKIEEESHRREEARKLEQESKRKECDKRKSEDSHKIRDLKKDPRKDERRPVPDRRRSRSPISRRRPEPPRRPVAAPPSRRFARSSPPLRRRSPYSRGRPRSRSPSPFGRAAPAPYVHGAPSLSERAPLRMIDRRLEEERIEVERRQRAEAEALEREKRQLRLERERLEREKLNLVRLERERVKKEMEEVAARKELAERRRQEELHRQQQQQQQEEEQRKREEARLELERRPRESVRQSSQLVSHVDPQIELYDPRVPLAEEYSRSQVDAKFSGRLGPALQREPVQIRHDDRRREDRRRESPIAPNPRIERRIPSYLEQWGGQEIKPRGEYIDQSRNDSLSSKRPRSRSPQRSNGAFSQIPSSDFRGQSSMNASDSWRGSQAPPAPSAASYMDNRRAPAVPRALDQPQSGSHWTSPARVAFPPAYAQPEPSRGFLTGSSSSSGFGMSSSSGYRRY